MSLCDASISALLPSLFTMLASAPACSRSWATGTATPGSAYMTWISGVDVDVGLGSDQALGDVDLILARPGDMTQRRHAAFILRVGIGACLEHHVHHRNLAFDGGAEGQGPAL